MQPHVADRLVVHGNRTSRVGVILEIVEGTGQERYRVRWNDGHESMISPAPDASVVSDPKPTWEQVRAAREASTRGWRPSIVAGVGREASLAQEALDRKLAQAG